MRNPNRAIVFCALMILCTAFPSHARQTRPNIIFLLADDLGWNGLSCYGSDLHQTPNLDRLAAQGVRFTDAYAACTVCSPTRAAVMTGMYPARLHVTDWITGQKRPYAKLRIPDWTMQLELHHVTIAEALKAGGYKTAHVGKWHLGGERFFPQHQGFDLNIGGSSSGGPSGGYHLPNRMKLPPPAPKKGDYLTDRLTDEALKIIDRWQDQPFFLYFPYYTVHTPIQGKRELISQYSKRVKKGGIHTNATYAAMHHSLDQSVGRIMAKLDELRIADRTYIFFTSDNGGLSHKFGKPTGITKNTPLRRGKGGSYEGGVPLPLIVRGPGISKTNRRDATPITSVDYYPTLLALAGAKGDPKHNRDVDGVSIAPLLHDAKATLDRDAIYWHYPHYHAGGDALPGKLSNGPYAAIRAGDWKLIEFFEDKRVELYNLKQDIGEKKDRSKDQADRANTLRDQLHAWQKRRLAPQMPTPNPEFDAKRGPDAKKKPVRKKKAK